MKDRPARSLRPADSSGGPSPWREGPTLSPRPKNRSIPRPVGGPPSQLPKPRPMPEGQMDKGGINEPPTSPRPNVRVRPQSGKPDQRKQQNMEMREAARAELDKLHTIQGCAAERLDCIKRLESEIESLRKNLKSQLDWWYQIPVGVDEEADAGNTAPDDQTAHIAGLAVQEIRRALADPK